MREQIEAIHDSGRRVVVAVTGGGATAVAELLAVPGGSRSLVEAVIPYSASALCDWLGGTPDQACSEATARAMAMAAWLRARQLDRECDVAALVGVSCTASLASDRPKRGEHRVHAAIQTRDLTRSYSLTLAKEERNRQEEENVAASLLLLALSESCECNSDALQAALDDALLPGETVRVGQQRAGDGWGAVLLDGRALVDVPDGESDDLQGLLFPGAFNPPHRGHLKMAEIAEARTGNKLAWEICLQNADKPPLDWIAVAGRLAGLRAVDARRPIVLSSDAKFVEKALSWPGATFVVGVDTLTRIAEPRFYDDAAARHAALAQLREQGVRLLVFGREVDGVFLELDDLELPSELCALCDGVDEGEFRDDVSSSALRGVSEPPIL